MKILNLCLLSVLLISLGCSNKEIITDDVRNASADAAFGSFASGESIGGSGSGSPNDPGVITAGEWNDLENWEFWHEVLTREDYGEHLDYWNINPTYRYDVHVTSGSGEVMVDIPVYLEYRNEVVWTGRTNNKGKAVLWGNPFGRIENFAPNHITIRVEGNFLSEVNPKTYEQGVNNVILESGPPSFTTNADIAFVVDATGSMGDELEYLKVELQDVLLQVQNTYPTYNIRTGSVFYRDEGDDYLTKQSGFTANFEQTTNFIKAQSAGGGGDYPEAVHTALSETVDQLEWSPYAQNRIMFFLLDAPPHYEEQVLADIAEATFLAAQKGVRLIPITASGIGKDTEFLMRLLAIATNGTYVFITDDSGIGHDHLEPTVGDYEVEFLNELMLRLIKEYLE